MKSSAKQQTLHKCAQRDPWNSDFPSNSGPCDNGHELGTFHLSLTRGTHYFIIMKYPYLWILLNILIKGCDSCQAAPSPLPHCGSFWDSRCHREHPQRNSKDEPGRAAMSEGRFISTEISMDSPVLEIPERTKVGILIILRLWGYFGEVKLLPPHKNE